MRRLDSGWRDDRLGPWHEQYGFTAPAPGLKIPMIEYDRGKPLAVISYQNRRDQLPTGEDVTRAYHAFGELRGEDGKVLPFITAQYDTRNWAFRLFPHNKAAMSFLDTTGWISQTESQFCDTLYRLRGRYAPYLAAYGVDFGTSGWIATEPSRDFAPAENWPGALMSARRRNYEPVMQTRMSWRNPCLDIDFAVVNGEGDRIALVVDYKAPGARVNTESTNMQALSGLYTKWPDAGSTNGSIPAMICRYDFGADGWTFRVHCLNKAARSHLAYSLGACDGYQALAETVAGTDWVDLDESQWKNVLHVAKSL